MRRVHVFVTGRVQGVYYRHACAQEASTRQVKGYVRNLSDGRVEAVFEGAPDAVQELIDWCRRGPPSAEVSGLELHESTPANEKTFEIQH